MESNTVSVLIQEFDSKKNVCSVQVNNDGTYESLIYAFIEQQKRLNVNIVLVDTIFSISPSLEPEVDMLTQFGNIEQVEGRPPTLLYFGIRQQCIKCSSVLEIGIKIVITICSGVLLFYLCHPSLSWIKEHKAVSGPIGVVIVACFTVLWRFAGNFQQANIQKKSTTI
jgi:hypothetical protein